MWNQLEHHFHVSIYEVACEQEMDDHEQMVAKR